MNEDELRERIYEHLGLDVGSLASESGNDWERAKKEVRDEYRRETIEKVTEESSSINFAICDKSSEEFQLVLKSKAPKLGSQKETIASRIDLSDDEMKCLIDTGSKEVHLTLLRSHSISPELLNLLIPKSVFLAKKLMIETQELGLEQKENLKNEMMKLPGVYTELLEKVS